MVLIGLEAIPPDTINTRNAITAVVKENQFRSLKKIRQLLTIEIDRSIGWFNFCQHNKAQLPGRVTGLGN